MLANHWVIQCCYWVFFCSGSLCVTLSSWDFRVWTEDTRLLGNMFLSSSLSDTWADRSSSIVHNRQYVKSVREENESANKFQKKKSTLLTLSCLFSCEVILRVQQTRTHVFVVTVTLLCVHAPYLNKLVEKYSWHLLNSMQVVMVWLCDMATATNPVVIGSM